MWMNTLNSRKALDYHKGVIETTTCMNEALSLDGKNGFKILAENLLLQLDNCGSENMFSKFSKKLCTSMTFTFPHVMQHFQLCQTTKPTPFLLTHIPDLKNYIDGYLCDGSDALVGPSRPLQCRFYM